MTVHFRSKGENEVIVYRFEFARSLETLWRPAKQYALTVFVRPTTPNGFEYECTNAGQTSQDEPAWPTTIGATINDGSVEWTARDFGLSASDTISTRTIAADNGVTIDSSAIADTGVLVTISGGTLGQVYDVACRIVTAAGETIRDLLRLTIIE